VQISSLRLKLTRIYICYQKGLPAGLVVDNQVHPQEIMILEANDFLFVLEAIAPASSLSKIIKMHVLQHYKTKMNIAQKNPNFLTFFARNSL